MPDGLNHDGFYRFGEFSISPAQRRLYRRAEEIPLPPKAFDAAYLFARNHGNLITRKQIFDTLWPDTHVAETNLTNIIVLLRKILGKDAIQTVSKFGYRFTLPVTDEPGVKQDAYASFVRGKELLVIRTLDSIQRARDLFWVCIAEDPHFAPAWAWLGRACRLLEKFKGDPPQSPSLAEAAFQRAFAIDPDLACAHQFYTQVQVDSGRASEAMTRLANRLRTHRDEPETYASLVQVLRSCGLLKESLAAHERAIALDPAIKTSVAHTHFLLCDFARVFETYSAQFYLDAASWAALGNTEHACTLLRTRLSDAQLGSGMLRPLMSSLLAALEGKYEETIAIIRGNTPDDPEATFYLARHCAMLNCAEAACQLVHNARLSGFLSPYALNHDPAFNTIREHTLFRAELREAMRLKDSHAQALRKSLGTELLPV
jgi:DNA-binding winged helix-turn-helix (wHTH) protein